MTEQELENHRKWCRCKYGYDDGNEVFQQAYAYAIQRYQTIEKVNQSLFGFLCRWAAREIKKHERYEVPFSCLSIENSDKADEVEFDPETPEWEKDFVAIEEKDEIEKKYGQWFLNALLSYAKKPPKNMVTTDRTIYEKQMKLFEYV